MKASEKLKAIRELGEIFDIKSMKQIRSMEAEMKQHADELLNKALSLPRNPCSGPCACSGACLSDEAHAMMDVSYKISHLMLDVFKSKD